MPEACSICRVFRCLGSVYTGICVFDEHKFKNMVVVECSRIKQCAGHTVHSCDNEAYVTFSDVMEVCNNFRLFV